MSSHRKRRRLEIALLAGLAFLLWIAGIFLGPTYIGVDEIWRGLSTQGNEPASIIVREFRLPATTTAALAGAALALSGLMMQTYFRNPLAGPDVLGVSAGASLGVALVFLIGGTSLSSLGALSDWMGALGTFGAATLGSMIVLLLALFAARYFDDSITLLVLGLMLATAASGAVAILVQFARPDQLQAYLRWMLGSYDVGWRPLLPFSLLVATCTIATLLVGKSLNVIQLGLDQARSLGVTFTRMRITVLAIAAVLAGATTAVCGPIAFLGIAAPHVARSILRTSDHKWLIPASLLVGIALSCGIHAASKSMGGKTALPINAISGVLGAPLVISIILRRNRP